MTEIDKRRKLKEESFTYRAIKNGKVFIHWHGREVMILNGKTAEKFIASVQAADSQQA